MDDLTTFLETLLYKIVTITVMTFADEPLTFSGILYNIQPPYVSLILKPASCSMGNGAPYINFNRHYHPAEIKYHPGAIVEIPIDKIDAVTHFPL